MGSVFTTSDSIKITGAFGKESNIPFYLQFVPGVVVDISATPTGMASFSQYENLGTILAKPHIVEGRKKDKLNVDMNDRYYPLLRGMYELPALGDPVLLCTIGGINYYLGPLNTKNMVNFNDDNLYKPETSFFKKDEEGNIRRSKGESRNFKKVKFQRLGKIPNEELEDQTAINETHGDMMFEGRHGNSIRIGSRDVNPYIIMSNARPTKAFKESLGDGSIFSITEKGSLAQHFGDYIRHIDIVKTQEELTSSTKEKVVGFTLASDSVLPDDEPQKRFMSSLVSSVNGTPENTDIIYEYGKLDKQNQMLLHSDRITINSKLDDLFLSSNKDIHIGTKRHLTISTNEDLIIESENTYLGNPNVEGKEMDKMVLGSVVQEALNGIIDLIKEITINTQLGPQSPMPLPSESTVKEKIKAILSKKHFIEK